jgi:hypothetical protein
MNSRPEMHMNQMAAENVEAIHWLTWPIRFIIDLIKTAIFLAIFILAVPLIFAGLVLHFILTGQSLLDADAVLALKVIFTFVAPFAVSIAYRVAQWYQLYRLGGNCRRDAVRRRYKFSHHRVFFITLGLMAVGAVFAFSWWDGMSDEASLGGLVLYLSSPMVLLLVKKRSSFTTPKQSLRFPLSREGTACPTSRIWQ